ncbi:MAG: hypothetical protein IT454_13240 [Planctomycetes bacterium]|nr:hypothetical protein [Planctomycetota bacterium]
MPARRSRWIDLGFALYCVSAFAAVTWPVYAWTGNRIRPFVLGLPLSLAWIVGWILATFLALAIYEFWGQRR